MVDQYVGVVMLLSIFVNGALLVETGWLCGRPPVAWRWMLGAAIGGMYVVLCLQPSFMFAGTPFCRVAAMALIGLLSFGCEIKEIVIFLLLSFGIEGIVIGAEEGRTCIAVISAVGMVTLCALYSRRKKNGGNYVPVELKFGDKCMRLTALQDTGNMLFDPITGEQVLVVDSKISHQLTGLSKRQLQQPIEVMRQPPIPGLRLIPYKTIGQSGGLLLGMRLPTVRIGNRLACLLVAFAPEEFSSRGEFQALTGGMV